MINKTVAATIILLTVVIADGQIAKCYTEIKVQ